MRKFAVRWWVKDPRERFDKACAELRGRWGIGMRFVNGRLQIFYELS